MGNEERVALVDFDRLVHDSNGNMQEFINIHKGYCRTIAIEASVHCLYLLLDNYYDAPHDDMYRFLNKLYENRDLMMEDDK